MVGAYDIAQLTAGLENTVERLNSLKRKLNLLQVSVINNINYLNPFDIKVYRKMVQEVEEELESLHIINSNITYLVAGCGELLDEIERQHNLTGNCYIVGENPNLSIDFDEMLNRIRFQLEGLITTRGVKSFYVDATGELGKASLETLVSLKDKYEIAVQICTPNRNDIKPWVFDYISIFDVNTKEKSKSVLEDAKFKIEWDSNINNLVCVELNK